MSLDNIRDRYLDSDIASSRWEKRPSNYSIDDLDHDEIKRTVKIGIREGRIDPKNYSDNIQDLLVHLNLYKNNTLHNAAMVLFGKDLYHQLEYTHCFLRLGRFLDEGMNEALDTKQLGGNAFELFREADAFIRRHIPVASRFQNDSFERIDEAALPLLAVREAIINSIVHRDYSKG